MRAPHGRIRPVRGRLGVTYTSARTRINNDNFGSSGRYPGASGANYVRIWFDNGPYFIVNDIALTPDQVDLTLSLGASFTAADCLIELSGDGSYWQRIDYTDRGAYNIWEQISVDFTLAVPVQRLFIRFTPQGSQSYGVNFDDLKLTTGPGGQTVDLDGGDYRSPSCRPIGPLRLRPRLSFRAIMPSLRIGRRPSIRGKTCGITPIVTIRGAITRFGSPIRCMPATARAASDVRIPIRGRRIRRSMWRISRRFTARTVLRFGSLSVLDEQYDGLSPAVGILGEGTSLHVERTRRCEPADQHADVLSDQHRSAAECQSRYVRNSLGDVEALFCRDGTAKTILGSRRRRGKMEHVPIRSFSWWRAVTTEHDYWQEYDSFGLQSGRAGPGAETLCTMPTHQFKMALRTKSGSTGKRIQQCTADELQAVGFWMRPSPTVRKPAPARNCAVSRCRSASSREKMGMTFFPEVPEEVKTRIPCPKSGILSLE